MISALSSAADHKSAIALHGTGLVSTVYTAAPDVARDPLVGSLKELAFMDTSLSWAAFFEVVAGVYLCGMVLWYIGKGVYKLHQRFKSRG